MEGVSRGRRIFLLAAALVFVGIIIISIIIGISNSNKNQFGSFIKIQNYDQRVQNVSGDVKDAIQTTLYKLVEKNSPSGFDPGSVKDAIIRDGSDKQVHDREKDLYTGSFIIDMESVKQSFNTQYSYSRTNTLDVGGNAIVLSCLPDSLLKFGSFDCKDFVMEQTNKYDEILQYLPYENFSFKITPDATANDGTLTLVVKLTIPESDLVGSIGSRTQVVSLYKKEVVDWIKSKGLDPLKFKMSYNYTDSGEQVLN
jgi:hypothetical protein